MMRFFQNTWKKFKDYFNCGILVHGFARAYCANCSGDFINADVHIEESNRRGAERLIRYCARPAFSGEKLRLISEKTETADGTRLQYDVNKGSQKTEPPLILTATELFDNLAKLIPPPHRHRHHYHGVLAPNSKQRAKVTQFANHYYRPDTTENRALQDDLKIEADASKLIVKPQAKTDLTRI